MLTEKSRDNTVVHCLFPDDYKISLIKISDLLMEVVVFNDN